MLIHDDGLQLVDEEQRKERIEFYADHSIGWTARPAHGSEGFQRKGKFKKVRYFFGLRLAPIATHHLAYISVNAYGFCFDYCTGCLLSQALWKNCLGLSP